MATSPSSWEQYKAEVQAGLDIHQVYADIKATKPSGNGHVLGLCPFHDDHNPSFGFDTKTGAWECFAGCGKGSVFDFVARQMGTDFKDALVSLGRDLGLEPPSSNGDRPAQVEYSYRDESGAELFQVVRSVDKRFWQRKPNGRGGYSKGVQGVRRVLYRLPEMLAQPDATIVIVEGEKDVERLRRGGIVATTNPGGAGKWKPEFGQFLEGRDVVILPDNDEPGRSHASQVARMLSGVTRSVKIVGLPDLPEKGDVSDWLDAGHSIDELRAIIDRAAAQQPDTIRPSIRINNRQLCDVIDEVWQLLLGVNDPPTLFVASGQLARLARSDTDVSIQRFDDAIAYGHLLRAADWVAVYDTSISNKKPPTEVARDIQANPHPSLPRLETVVAAPFFDAQRNLVSTPGYHAQAATWLELPSGWDNQMVPDRLTEAHLAWARSLILDDLLTDFPFTSNSDRTHAVAAFLLPFVRQLITGPTPIHLVEAPTPGSGKSLLSELVAIVALGEVPGSTTLTRDENESRKKITAILSRAAPIVTIDNLDGGLWSAQIASAITSTRWEDRVLGKTQMVVLPNRALWLVSANNPDMSQEIARRCVRIRLDPGEEQPWTRTGFKHDPIREWAKENRQDLVRALLIAVSSWVEAGAPSGAKTLGSFESWSRVIGGILGHIGMNDFLAGTEEFYAAADPESGEWSAFVEAWWGRYGGAPVTTGDLLQLATDDNLVAFAHAAKSDNGRLAKFGKQLRRIRDRRFGDRRVVTDRNTSRHSNDYRLIAVETDLFNGKEAVQ